MISAFMGTSRPTNAVLLVIARSSNSLVKCSEKFHVECACQTTDTTKNMSGPILQHEQNDDDY